MKVIPKHSPLVILACLGTAAVAADKSAADNWPRFRGPNATGVTPDHPSLPDRWSTTENVKWKTEIPGYGWSSPVIWGDKVFLTTVTSDGNFEKPKKGLYLGEGRKEPPRGEHHWLTYCLGVANGEVLWKREAHRSEPRASRHPKSTYAAETPTTDGERLYVLFGDVGLYCYDLGGELLWSHAIDLKATFYDYGAAASPVVHAGQVFMIYDNQEASYIAAFDARTGASRWRTEREEKSTWATPLVWQNDLRTEIVTAGKRRIRSYDLGGKLLWELDGRMSNLIIPSPFSSLGHVYLASGYVGDRNRPVYAIKPGAAGDITLKEDEKKNAFVQWYQPQSGPYNPSPIVYRDHYYTLLDQGFMTCHDAHSGEEIYGKTRLPVGSSFTSSPWAYNGKIFCLSEDGDTYVIEAGKTFKLLHTNSLGELCMATPAACQGKLFIRTASKLYCFNQLSKP